MQVFAVNQETGPHTLSIFQFYACDRTTPFHTRFVPFNGYKPIFAENPLKSVGLITSTFDDALQTLADSPDPGVQKIVQNEKTQNAHFRVPGIFLVRPKVTSHATKVENEWCYCDVYSHLSEHLVDCVDINGDSVIVAVQRFAFVAVIADEMAGANAVPLSGRCACSHQPLLG